MLSRSYSCRETLFETNYKAHHELVDRQPELKIPPPLSEGMQSRHTDESKSPLFEQEPVEKDNRMPCHQHQLRRWFAGFATSGGITSVCWSTSESLQLCYDYLREPSALDFTANY
jgi:hypothetical protein